MKIFYLEFYNPLLEGQPINQMKWLPCHFWLYLQHNDGLLRRQVLNQLINVFWTVLAFAPVIAFWLAEGTTIVLYILIALSLTVLFLPDRVYQHLQLSDDISYYENLGIRFFRWFTQDGDLVTQILSKGQGNYGRFRSRKNLERIDKQIEGYERYHLTCFAFFVLTLLYAMLRTNFAIAILILLSNVVYNVIPLLLQQYNKIRLRRIRQ